VSAAAGGVASAAMGVQAEPCGVFNIQGDFEIDISPLIDDCRHAFADHWPLITGTTHVTLATDH
jgi:hypothetical protein